MTEGKRLHPPLYRAAQFFAAVRAGLPAWLGGLPAEGTGEAARRVTALLPAAPQQRLFDRMPANDRRHALAVARTLVEAGQQHPALLQAALLHDVGKCLGQPLLHRVLIVLLEAFWPAGLAWLARECEAKSGTYAGLIAGAGWWRRPFIIHACHPAIGAAMAAEAGCDPLAVSLIARHQVEVTGDPAETEEKLLAALQWADNMN